MGKTSVLLSGAPGNMIMQIGRRILASEDFTLAPFALTGPDIKDSETEIDGHKLKLYNPSNRDGQEMKREFPNLVAVDYTDVSAVLDNARFFCDSQIPFVMGTSVRKDDKGALEELITDAGIRAVVSPNMSPQIVGLQEAIENYAQQHPNVLKGCALWVPEAHQKPKGSKPSATAGAIIGSFNRMGIEYSAEGVLINDLAEIPQLEKVKKIGMIREPALQLAWGIPQQYLGGHGWHTYTITASPESQGALVCFGASLFNFLCNSPVLREFKTEQVSGNLPSIIRTSPDGTVLLSATVLESNKLQIKHNVNGRSTYVDGTMYGLRYVTDPSNPAGLSTMSHVLKRL